jgi:hypothetical protein
MAILIEINQVVATWTHIPLSQVLALYTIFRIAMVSNFILLSMPTLNNN